jgi:hypothetical protein
MYHMTKHFLPLALLPLLLATACKSTDTPSGSAARSVRNRGFVKATITRHFDANENPVKTTSITVEDPTQLQKLLMFFPGIDTNRQSPTKSNWKSHVDIRFFREDKTSLKISSDYKVWTENTGANGDFPLRGPLRQYINTLFP